MGQYQKNCLMDCSISSKIDLRQSDNKYILEMDIPGMKREDVSVRVVDHTLILESNKRDDRSVQHDSENIQEWSASDFQKEFYLAENIDLNTIEAFSTDGVLTIHLYTIKPTSQQIQIN